MAFNPGLNLGQHQKPTICIQLTASMSLLLSNHVPPFTMIHSITWLLSVNHSSPCPQPFSTFCRAYLFDSLSLQTNTFSTQSASSFLKHVHTVAIYFFVPLLLCHLFLTVALILCKKVISLVSRHISN